MRWNDFHYIFDLQLKLHSLRHIESMTYERFSV